MAGPTRPPWWPVFIAVERAVGERLERATRSEEFARILTTAAHLDGALRAAYLSATAQNLHRANLPAWSDLVRLSEQLAALERRVADLGLKVERMAGGEPPARPRSSRRQPRSSDR